MRKKLLSLVLVVAMLCTMCTCVFAFEVSDAGNLAPKVVDAITYKNGNNKLGIAVICDIPESNVTSATIKLYDASNTELYTKTITASADLKVPEVNWVTSGARACWEFWEVSDMTAGSTYKAVITLSDGTNNGTATINNIEMPAGGYEKAYSGYSFGRSTYFYGIDRDSVPFAKITVDDTFAYTGANSLKYQSYGFMWHSKLSSRYDWKTRVAWANSINFGFNDGTYWEYSFVFTDKGTWDTIPPSLVNPDYKGKITDYAKNVDIEGMKAVKETVEPIDNGWYRYTGVFSGSGKGLSKHPIIQAPHGIDVQLWFDNIQLRKITDYDTTTGTYSNLESNVLLGSGFETKVSNLRMVKEKVLTWSLEDSAYFAKLTIAKDGVKIGEIDGTKTAKGVQATTYTIADEDWDINSTYTVTAATGAGYADVHNTPTPGKEGEAVSIKGLSEIVIDNYNGAAPVDAIATNSGDGIIDVVWNMPISGKAVLKTTAELLDADGDTIASNIVTAQAGQKNVYTTFRVVDKTAKYSVKITAVYDDLSAGVAAIDEVYADAEKTGNDVSGSNTFKGMVYGNWWAIAKSTNGRLVYDISYDTENKKANHGSLKIDFRGAIVTNSATGTESFSDNHAASYGNTYLLINNVAGVKQGKYYEIEYTYKSTPRNGFGDGVSLPRFCGGTDTTKDIGNDADYVAIGTKTNAEGNTTDVYKLSATDDNGWTTVKALYKATSNASFYFSIINEWSARRVLWIDSATLKEAVYDETNKSYTVTGNNLLVGGDLDFEVKDAVMEADNDIGGIITWTEPYPEMVHRVKIYTADGNFIDQVAGGTNFITVPDYSKEYILKVVTKNASKTSTVETPGVMVARAEDVPETEIGEISLDKNGTKANASVTVKNNKRPSLPAMLIIAEYEGNAFVKLISVETTLSAGNPQETLSGELTLNKEGNTVKAFLFESYSSMKPLAKSVMK